MNPSSLSQPLTLDHLRRNYGLCRSSLGFCWILSWCSRNKSLFVDTNSVISIAVRQRSKLFQFVDRMYHSLRHVYKSVPGTILQSWDHKFLRLQKHCSAFSDKHPVLSRANALFQLPPSQGETRARSVFGRGCSILWYDRERKTSRNFRNERGDAFHRVRKDALGACIHRLLRMSAS